MLARRVLTLAALVVGLAAAPSASADIIPTTPLPACGSPPCVVSVLHGTAPLPYPSTAGDQYAIFVSTYMLIGARYFSFLIDDDAATMTTADEFTITINTGSTYPAETFARGQGVVVTRSGAAPGPHCPHDSATGADGLWRAGRVQQLRRLRDDCAHARPGSAERPDRRSRLHRRPRRQGRDARLRPRDRTPTGCRRLCSSTTRRTRSSSTSRTRTSSRRGDRLPGAAEFRIPNAMLRRLYHVDDPPTLTASAFRVTTGSGPAATVVDINPGSVHVAISGLTFSKRRLRIHGDTRPLRPRNLRAVRTSPTTARLRFDSSRRRGSLVRGYVANCRLGTRWVVRGQSLRPPIRVRGLIPGRSYTCRVRAKSRAGLGRVARTVIPAVS